MALVKNNFILMKCSILHISALGHGDHTDQVTPRLLEAFQGTLSIFNFNFLSCIAKQKFIMIYFNN